jgi:thiol-disulfide isomerase/thioredoxin
LALTGLVALLSGAGAAHWYRQRLRLDAGTEQAFWDQTLTLTSGEDLTLAQWRGQPLVVNFWATWCPPCVEEMPLLDDFFRQNSAKGWKMIGIAIDQPSQIKRFLEQRPVSYPIAYGGLDGMKLGELLGNESGSLPFTLVLAADGRLILRKLGKLSANEIAKWG